MPKSSPYFSAIFAHFLIPGDTGNQHITGECFSHLRQVTALSSLEVNDNPNITGERLFCLQGLPLISLSMADTRVNDNSLGHLPGMPISILDLAGTLVTNAGLIHLEMLPLVEVSFFDTEVTEDARRRLEALLGIAA